MWAYLRRVEVNSVNPRIAKFKEKYEGKTFTNRHGEKFTVKEYINSQHLVLDWGNGEITKNNLTSVRNGSATYRTPEWMKRTREGMLFSARNGDKFYVKEYRHARDITVVWEDGSETVSDWAAIKSGNLSRFSREYYKNKYEGFQIEVEHGVATIVKYYNSQRCLVRWDDGTEKEYITSNVLRGELSNPSKFRKGLGSRENHYGDDPEILDRWNKIFARRNYKKGYENVYISPCIQVYEDFEKVYRNLKGEEGWQIDKDILSISKGFKPYYSLDTIALVPQEVNSLMRRSREKDENLPEGVTTSKENRVNKYKATYRERYLGRYPTPHQAQEAYVKAKKDHARELAERYKGKIDERVYKILLDIPVEGWDYTFDELKDREKEQSCHTQ